MKTSFPLSELLRAESLRPLAKFDETDVFGQLLLRSDGKFRYWMAADDGEAAEIQGGVDNDVYQCALSWSAISSAVAVARLNPDADIALETVTETDGTPGIVLSGPFGSMVMFDRQDNHPDISTLRIPPLDVAAEATVPADMFRELVAAARYQRERPEDRVVDLSAKLTISDNRVEFTKSAPRTGSISFGLDTEHGDGNLTVRVNPEAIGRLLQAARPSDEVTIMLSQWATDVIWFEGADWVGFVQPYKTTAEQAVDHAKAIIHDLCGPAALICDPDGNYPLVASGNPVSGSFTPEASGATWLKVTAVIATGVDASPGVFAELNDFNNNGTFIKLHHDATNVLASVDLVANTLDEPELRLALERISEVATNVMPVLTAVHGGTIPNDEAEIRWANYRNAIIEASFIPNNLTTIAGDGAAPNFPFPESCWVVSGWNPLGAIRSESDNRHTNQQIAHDIIDAGGQFVSGYARSADGSFFEETLIIWGVSPDTARSFGRRAQRDAIFAIDQHSVHLMSCATDRIESWMRVPQPIHTI